VRRLLLVLLACGAVAAAVVAAACGSASSGTGASPSSPQADAGATEGDADTGTPPGADAGAAPDTGPDVALADACGDPPRVNVDLEILGLSLTDTDGGSPLPGVLFSASLCPGLAQYSDDAGAIHGQITRGVPFYGKLEKKGYLSVITPEENFPADQPSTSFVMLPQLFSALLDPPPTATSTAILISVRALSVDAGACSSFDGISFAVPGHPEAMVAYYTGDIPAAVDGGTATATRGLASISGLASGQYVTVTATKPGCHVALANGTSTGRVWVESGFLSLMPAYVSQ
jgi:hypothetical protein